MPFSALMTRAQVPRIPPPATRPDLENRGARRHACGMDRITVRLIICGLVQGVGYRWWARNEARRLGLDGWVRNRGDGTVELLASGPSAAVEQLLDACRRGPSSARVGSIARFEAADAGVAGFEERPTIWTDKAE
jgi:acylphosphatase